MALSLFLTTGEVAELTDALENLLRDGVGSYVHVSNADYSKDITVAVYSTDTGGSSAFRERVRRLIAKDE